jgi:eukaryotic-like serine/threonine-protein kinase
MKAEQWPAVEQLYHAALERAAEERAAFLCEACGGDEGLRSEVESLLAYQDKAKDFIENTALEIAGELMADGQQSLVEGQALNHYTILELLGAGGMGEVYLAEDTRLKRRVALKLLPAELTANRDRLLRFEQEARAASALNHPNILTIYEIGQAESTHFISTEYVEGDTLRLHLSSQMKLDEVLEICIQVASALAAAHAADIIHRDIKPENIMLRRDGIVKVLDFGLAKLLAPRSTEIDTEDSTRFQTSAGVVMGTASYMSPEQTRGFAVDGRTDIWSLGAMLYEMATSRQPFEGKTPSDVIALILQKEPLPLTHFSPEVPTELERIVRKALHKDKEERYQTIKDLLIDLRNLRKELELSAQMERTVRPIIGTSDSSVQSTGAIAHSTSSAEYIFTEIKQHKRPAALILGPVIIASAVVLYLFFRHSALPKQAALPSATFTQLTDQSGPEYFPSLSPDGKSFVYAGYASGNWDIYLQRVGGKNPINLTKDSPADDTQPSFSPDGESIAFRSEREGSGIFLMGATGESVKRLTNFGFNPAWSPDGKEIACADEGVLTPEARWNPNNRMWAFNVATGEKRQITKVDAVQPNWSPHGYRIAFQGRRNNAQRDIWTVPAGGGEVVEVTNDAALDWNPVWAPDGNHLYFVSDRGGSMNLWRVPIEENTGKFLGPPEAVTTPSLYISHLSFSRDGRRMLYVHTVRSEYHQRVAFDPVREIVVGQTVRITQGSRQAFAPHLSTDGEWLVYTQSDRQEDILVVRRDGTGLRQLTDDSYKDRAPRCHLMEN